MSVCHIYDLLVNLTKLRMRNSECALNLERFRAALQPVRCRVECAIKRGWGLEHTVAGSKWVGRDYPGRDQTRLRIFRASWAVAISRPYSRAILTTLSTNSALLLASRPLE